MCLDKGQNDSGPKPCQASSLPFSIGYPEMYFQYKVSVFSSVYIFIIYKVQIAILLGFEKIAYTVPGISPIPQKTTSAIVWKYLHLTKQQK